MNAKYHPTETITPGKDERVVRLSAPATIAGTPYAAAATVIVPAATAKWLIEQGSAKLLKPGKDDTPQTE